MTPGPVSASSKKDPITHYILVRSDIPWLVRGIQIAHAAGESSPGDLPADTHVVLCDGGTEAALAREADYLEALGVQVTRIYEDRAPYAGALMAVGLRPARKGELRAATRHLRPMPP